MRSRTPADLKATFPKARWLPETRVWSVPGKIAFKRCVLWAERVTAGDKMTDRQRLIAAADFDAAPKSAYVRLGAETSIVASPYDERIVAICRRLGGKFDSTTRKWAIPSSGLKGLIGATAEIDALAKAAAERDARKQQKWQSEREAQRQQWAAEKAARTAARDAHRAEVRSHRMMVSASRAPAAGTVMRHCGDVVTIESLGTVFRVSEESASMGIDPALEGERACYAYFRAATEAETADLVAREAAAAADKVRQTARRDAIAAISRSSDAPHIGHAPEGEVLWSDDRHTLTGYRTWIVLIADGWLWHLTYDGTDAGAWGEFNCGYNTRGARLPADEALLAAIKGRHEGRRDAGICRPTAAWRGMAGAARKGSRHQ